MPHYFFDHGDDGRIIRDEAGLDLPSLEAAQSEAVRALSEYGRELFPGQVRKEISMLVREGGQPVFQATIHLEAKRIDPS